MPESVIQVFAILVPVVTVLGILNAMHAVMNVRSPRGVIAWVAMLILLPVVAVPFYWIFGRHKFTGYIEARRAGNMEIHALAQKVLADLKPFGIDPTAPAYEASQLGEQLAGLPFTTGNDVDLLIDGDATFGAMFEAIDAAENYLLVQFFVVHDDQLGAAFRDRLVARAQAGIRVLFLYDDLGCNSTPASFWEPLREAGAQVKGFKPNKGWANRLRINFRNHRKILVADGRVAFVGGLNIGDKYRGADERFGAWRDTHMRLHGPTVQAIQISFIEDWNWAAGEIPELNWDPCPAPHGDQTVLAVPTGPADDLEVCHLFFLRAINLSKKRLWITSPYFVPDHAVVAALQLAALRGVDVRILLPERPDHLLVYLSAFSYFDEMQAVGAKLYRYQPGFMHQKVWLIDDEIALIGTANLDNRSFYLNFEMMLAVRDRDFAGEVAAMLESDLERCRPIAPDEYRDQPTLFKVAVRLARIASPLQ
jgi:cardiolipin synthase